MALLSHSLILVAVVVVSGVDAPAFDATSSEHTTVSVRRGRELVPTNTVSFSGLHGHNPISPECVGPVVYRFDVFRINAVDVPTEMVDVECFGYRAIQQLVHVPVRGNGFVSAPEHLPSETESPVATSVVGTNPWPTFSITTLVNIQPETRGLILNLAFSVLAPPGPGDNADGLSLGKFFVFMASGELRPLVANIEAYFPNTVLFQHMRTVKELTV